MADGCGDRRFGDRQLLGGFGDSQDDLPNGVVEDEQGGARSTSEGADPLPVSLDQLDDPFVGFTLDLGLKRRYLCRSPVGAASRPNRQDIDHLFPRSPIKDDAPLADS